jgi:hypothetical protein
MSKVSPKRSNYLLHIRGLLCLVTPRHSALVPSTTHCAGGLTNLLLFDQDPLHLWAGSGGGLLPVQPRCPLHRPRCVVRPHLWRRWLCVVFLLQAARGNRMGEQQSLLMFLGCTFCYPMVLLIRVLRKRILDSLLLSPSYIS